MKVSFDSSIVSLTGEEHIELVLHQPCTVKELTLILSQIYPGLSNYLPNLSISLVEKTTFLVVNGQPAALDAILTDKDWVELKT